VTVSASRLSGGHYTPETALSFHIITAKHNEHRLPEVLREFR